MTSTETPTSSPSRRSLILHDTLIFLALSAVTIVLLLITLGLFKSFEGHRDELGLRWSARGTEDLRTGHPKEAVAALRTALTYRDNLQTQLQLAQALADAGRTEEATNYFLTLRESRPGDGFLNLQLARLSRRKGDADNAVNYYRASIYGNWEGDGAVRRRDVRLELADYLASRGNTTSARDELMVAAGNAPETAANDTLFGNRLQAIGDSTDALTFYLHALALEHPDQTSTLATAGRLAYSMGRYDQAAQLLGEAVTASRARGRSATDTPALEALAAKARRLPELSLSRDLPATERAEHILAASRIALHRLNACLPAQPPTHPKPGNKLLPAQPPIVVDPVLIALKSQWTAVAPQLMQRDIARDAELDDTLANLINDTEQRTVQPCGAPTGDDALLLQLSRSSQQNP